MEGEHDVVRIEYDPGRSAHIALIKARSTQPTKNNTPNVPLTLDVTAWGPQPFRKTPAAPKELEKVCGGYSYILAPDGLRAGDVVRSYRHGIPAKLLAGLGSGGYEEAVVADAGETTELDTNPASPQTVLSPTSAGSASSSRALGLLRTLTLKPGNVLPLDLCPPGTIIHNISLKPEGKMQLCRSAGTFGQVVAHGIGKRALNEGEEVQHGVLGAQGWTLVKLQSGEVRKLHPKCVGTIGVVSK
jgi:ribosomal protein L2